MSEELKHPDDVAVDRFALSMKRKLKWEREERGRRGWDNPAVCSDEHLANLLMEHLEKGNSGNFEDVANFCMMLHQRGAHPRVLADIAAWNRRAPSPDMREAVEALRSMEAAPKDGADILVYYDHDADPYQDPNNPDRLTDYAAWAEGGPFMEGKGWCIAAWKERHWESTDEYGSGYWMPAYWFARQHDDYEVVVNPIAWMPLPSPPNDN